MIALDVDGVVLNLEQRIIELGEDLFARPMLRLNNRYRFADRYGLNELEIEQLWREFDQRGLLGQLKPYAGAIEAIQDMQSLGMPVAFVTGIGSNWQAARDANLRACGLRDFQLFCTGSAFEPKRPVLEAIGAHTFIDDRLRHLHDVQELIAHLVWIDLGDEQELDHSEISAHRYPSLATWFSCHRQELIELHQSNRQSRSE